MITVEADELTLEVARQLPAVELNVIQPDDLRGVLVIASCDRKITRRIQEREVRIVRVRNLTYFNPRQKIVRHPQDAVVAHGEVFLEIRAVRKR